LTRIYQDEGASGLTEERNQLQELLLDCKQGKIGTVVLPSLDRLSRDFLLTEELLSRFDQMGIQVLIVDMPTYDRGNPQSVLMRKIVSGEFRADSQLQ